VFDWRTSLQLRNLNGLFAQCEDMAIDDKPMDSLPSRPLQPHEVDPLLDNGFAPLVMMKSLPEELITDIGYEELAIADGSQVFALLYATEQKGVTVAYSQREDSWMKVVEMCAAEYDPDKIESKTRDFVKRHLQSDLDYEGSMDVDEEEAYIDRCD
jgi:hypothetical protein